MTLSETKRLITLLQAAHDSIQAKARVENNRWERQRLWAKVGQLDKAMKQQWDNIVRMLAINPKLSIN